MRATLCCWALSACTYSVAQDACDLLPRTHQRINYVDQVDVGGAARADLYNKAKAWLAGRVGDGVDSIRYTNTRSTMLIADCSFPLTGGGALSPWHDVRVLHTITITTTDVGYHYAIADFFVTSISMVRGEVVHQQSPLSSWLSGRGNGASDACRSIDQRARTLIASMHDGMAASPATR